MRVLAELSGSNPAAWAADHQRQRYFDTSLKGADGINRDEPAARRTLPVSVSADADRLLELARQELTADEPEAPEQRCPTEASGLLGQLLQDAERRPDGVARKDGVSPNRIVSVHDPEIRHGRKSASKRFDGYKSTVAVDADMQLITAALVLPGNAQDHEQALALVEQTEANAALTVEETVGDCAYGASETRQTFANGKRNLVAKVPHRRGQQHFPQDDLRIDLETMTCVGPAGHACRTVVPISSGKR